MKLTSEQLKKVLSMKRGELEVLSPFIFKKISLAHLDIDKDIILKFKCSNELSRARLKEVHGVDTIVHAFKNLDIEFIIKVLWGYISEETLRELKDVIKFTEINELGERTEVETNPFEKFKSLFLTDIQSVMELLDLFLTIHGYTKDQLKSLVSDPSAEDLLKTQESKKKKLVTDGYAIANFLKEFPQYTLFDVYSKFNMNQIGLLNKYASEIKYEKREFEAKCHGLEFKKELKKTPIKKDMMDSFKKEMMKSMYEYKRNKKIINLKRARR